MIGEVDPAAKPGDVVAAYDRGGRYFGQGFWHDRSQIALRMLTWEARPVDDAFFGERIATAVDWRGQIMAGAGDTNVCRLVHAEGDALSGLIAERYAEWIAIEVFSLGVFKRLELIKRLLAEKTRLQRFVVRADERIERLEGFSVTPQLSDEMPDTLEIREHGVRFRVDLRSGHKTGFFCDQRDNRLRLAGLCNGRHVLDTCCYTGGFGIYAMKLGQAASVTGVDLDEAAIELAKRNANLNQVRIHHAHSDVFTYFRQMQTAGHRFDVVVLDPPKFIASREEFDDGSRRYVDLNTLAMTVLKPGGLLVTCSCSGPVGWSDFEGIVHAAAGRAQRAIQLVDRSGAGPDHPIMSNCPESEYLKVVWARVL